MTTQHDVTIYVDGACSGNPGPGGWAAILTMTKADGSLYVKELSGSVSHTTNNVMELTAIHQALLALKSPCCINVVTDSANAIGWLSGGFKRNNTLIKEMCQGIEREIVYGQHCICYEKVKGHAGHTYNERCDVLAKAAVVKS